MAYKRTYIPVVALHSPDGRVTPLSIEWNGKKLTVDRITDVRPSAATKAGGRGIRYTCFIMGKKRFLFMDDFLDGFQWFVEEIPNGRHETYYINFFPGDLLG